MVSLTFPLAVAGTIAAIIFGAMFIYLVAKWSLKRTKELSKKFEVEGTYPQKEQKQELAVPEIDRRINEFKTRYQEAMNRGDKAMTNLLDAEIKRLEKERTQRTNKT